MTIGEEFIHLHVHVLYGVHVATCPDCVAPDRGGDWPGLEDERPYDELERLGYFDDTQVAS